MDYLCRHCAPLVRTFPSSLPVESIGYIPQKTEWVARSFQTFNFSFILSGCGEFHQRGRRWQVTAPCVITQWPGELPEYGPTGRSAHWEELFLIYAPSCGGALRRCGFVEESRPVWKIERPDAVRARLDELQTLLRHADRPGWSDRIDRACEALILESLLGGEPHEPGSHDRAIANLRRKVGEEPEVERDWNAEARRIGLSESTLRRRWLQLFQEPPGRSLQDARIRLARRLLAETELPIKEIARKSGFEDALYFSRRFRKETGLPAREYRRRHHPRQNG